MLLIANQKSFTTEILDAISRFADGNIYVAFTVLITLLSAGLLYVAIKKEKIDKKFFPLLWFFLITNFIFSATISMVTLPLKKEADTVNEEYNSLRSAIDKLEEVANTDQQNVNYLLKENRKLRETLMKLEKQNAVAGSKKRKTKPKTAIKIQIPEEPKLLKTEKSLEEIKTQIMRIDSAHFNKKKRSIKSKNQKEK